MKKAVKTKNTPEEKIARKLQTISELKRAAMIWGAVNFIMSVVSVLIAILNK